MAAFIHNVGLHQVTTGSVEVYTDRAQQQAWVKIGALSIHPERGAERSAVADLRTLRDIARALFDKADELEAELLMEAAS